MPADDHPGPEDARRALAGVDRVRRSVADRVAAPWWYHLGLGLSAAMLFASFDLPSDATSLGVPASGIVLPALLMWLVKWRTGVGVDRYRVPAGAGRTHALYAGLFLLLFAAGMIAEIGFEVPLAMTAAGLVVLLPSISTSYRLDLKYRDELRGVG